MPAMTRRSNWRRWWSSGDLTCWCEVSSVSRDRNQTDLGEKRRIISIVRIRSAYSTLRSTLLLMIGTNNSQTSIFTLSTTRFNRNQNHDLTIWWNSLVSQTCSVGMRFYRSRWSRIDTDQDRLTGEHSLSIAWKVQMDGSCWSETMSKAEKRRHANLEDRQQDRFAYR